MQPGNAHSGVYRDFEIVNPEIAVWREHYMQRSNLLLSGLFLTAALALSGPIVAAAAQDAGIQVRVYDSHHHDYHNWDDREDRAYRGYVDGRHGW